MDHFKGIVPEERWKNDVLSELRMIRELLGRDCKAIQPEPVQRIEPVKRTRVEPAKRPQQRRGVK